MKYLPDGKVDYEHVTESSELFDTAKHIDNRRVAKQAARDHNSI